MDRGDKDPFNRHLIVFMMDRSERGDPTAYAVPKAEYRKWGKWTKVTAMTRDLDHIPFFMEDDNATEKGIHANERERLDLDGSPLPCTPPPRGLFLWRCS